MITTEPKNKGNSTRNFQTPYFTSPFTVVLQLALLDLGTVPTQGFRTGLRGFMDLSRVCLDEWGTANFGASRRAGTLGSPIAKLGPRTLNAMAPAALCPQLGRVAKTSQRLCARSLQLQDESKPVMASDHGLLCQRRATRQPHHLLNRDFGHHAALRLGVTPWMRRTGARSCNDNKSKADNSTDVLHPL